MHQKTVEVLERCQVLLNSANGLSVKNTRDWDSESKNILAQTNLLTQKPCVYVCNVGEVGSSSSSNSSRNKYVEEAEAAAQERGAKCFSVSAQIEVEAGVFDSAEEKMEYLLASGIEKTGKRYPY